MALYLKIKELRIKKNLSVLDVAEATGFNRQNIYAWESGKSKPNPDAVRKLAEFFGVSATEIFTKVSNSTEPDSTTWLQGLVDEMRDERKQLLNQIDRLTRMLENAHLGKPFDVTLGGLASRDGYMEAVVVEMYPDSVANPVTSKAKLA